MADRPATDAVRLFHGRGLCYPGLEFINIDYYPPVVLVALYDVVEEGWLANLVGNLRELLGDELVCVAVQKRFLTPTPTEVVWGELPEQNSASENGLRYRLRLGHAQNVGLFDRFA